MSDRKKLREELEEELFIAKSHLRDTMGCVLLMFATAVFLFLWGYFA